MRFIVSSNKVFVCPILLSTSRAASASWERPGNVSWERRTLVRYALVLIFQLYASWERQTSVWHVFYVYIPPPCPLCPPGNAALQCGMFSCFCMAFSLFWERRTSVRHVFYVYIPPPCPLCPPCETFFFLSLCPLCSLCEHLFFLSCPPCETIFPRFRKKPSPSHTSRDFVSPHRFRYPRGTMSGLYTCSHIPSL